jgi:uncharacterized protein
MTRSVAHPLNAEPVNQTTVAMAGGYLLVTSITQGSSMAVFADRQCDMGMIGYEMTLLAARVGHMLTPARHPAHTGSGTRPTDLPGRRPAAQGPPDRARP